MKLFFEKMGWHILPVVIILVGSYSLFCIFRSILEKFEEPKLKRVVFALCFAFLALFVSVGISSYRPDVALSVRPKISKIEQLEAKAEAKQKKIDKISDQLEQALKIASQEKLKTFNPKDYPSEVITADWVQKNRDVIATLPDKELKDRYTKRFDDVESYFELN
ncbi:hypothetical protein V7G76_13905, partial [Enterococcus faecium]